MTSHLLVDERKDVRDETVPTVGSMGNIAQLARHRREEVALIGVGAPLRTRSQRPSSALVVSNHSEWMITDESTSCVLSFPSAREAQIEERSVCKKFEKIEH